MLPYTWLANLSLKLAKFACPLHLLSIIPLKVPHGGIIATIADAAMGGLASRSVPEGFNVVTTNMNISYIATTTNKELIARGRFVHKGRQTLVMECDIEDETGRKLAIATGSFFVIQRRP